MLAAMPPPPPVLFSTVMVWPSRSAILSASSRPMMSGLPPGDVPTRMRSGRCGQFCCARAGSAVPRRRGCGERERAAASQAHVCISPAGNIATLAGKEDAWNNAK